jgi:hypothetical protein
MMFLEPNARLELGGKAAFLLATRPEVAFHLVLATRRWIGFSEDLTRMSRFGGKAELAG